MKASSIQQKEKHAARASANYSMTDIKEELFQTLGGNHRLPSPFLHPIMGLVLLFALLPVAFGGCATMRAALSSLYLGTGGPTHWRLCNNNPCWPVMDPDSDPCSWPMVRCGGAGGCARSELISLDMYPGLGMTGSIPPTAQFAALLPNLSSISVKYNPRLTGDVASSLQGMDSLTELVISQTGLGGDLNHVFSSSPLLSLVEAVNCSFIGAFPNQMSALTKLHSFSVSYNQFYGALPDMRNLTSLTLLDASMCRLLSGSFPLLPPSVEFVNLAGNSLSGVIPQQSLFKMQSLDLSDNSFSGPLDGLKMCHNASSCPSYNGCGTGGPNLKYLMLGGNGFSGKLQDFIKNVLFDSNLFFRYPLLIVDVSDNNFTGFLSNLLAGETGLQLFDARGNSGLDSRLLLYSWLKLEPDLQRPFEKGSFSCASLVTLESRVQISMDPQVFSYAGCQCSSGFFGNSPNCSRCSSVGISCSGGSVIDVEAGFGPVVVSDRFLGVEPCRHCSASTFVFGSNVSYSCVQGYEKRLCAKCAPHYYKTELGCVSCGSTSGIESVMGVLVGVVFVVVLYVVQPTVILLHPKTASVFVLLFSLVLVAGAAVSLFFGSWILDALMILVLVILDESFDRVAIGRSTALVSRVLAMQKVLLFHIQATVLLNAEFWVGDLWRWAFFSLQFVNLNLRGLFACNGLLASFSSSVYADLWRLCLTPVFLFLLLLVLCWIQTLIEDAAREKQAKRKKEMVRPPEAPREFFNDSEEANLIPKSGEHVQEHADEELFIPTFQDRLLNLLFRILYTSYFEVCVFLLLSVKCVPDVLDTQLLFLFNFPWKPCSDRVWSISVPFLVLYGLGIPFLFGMFLLRNNRDSPKTKYYLSFVFETYRSGRTWFELVAVTERLLLAVALVLPNELVSMGVIALLLVFVLFRLLSKPFKSETDELFSVCSLVILAFTHSQIRESPISSTQSSLALTVIVSLFNLGFVAAATVVLLKATVRILVNHR